MIDFLMLHVFVFFFASYLSIICTVFSSTSRLVANEGAGVLLSPCSPCQENPELAKRLSNTKRTDG